MKAKFLSLLCTLCIAIPSWATAIVCSPDGDYCKQVKFVSMGLYSDWETACCHNVNIPNGHNCIDDCNVAKKESSLNPSPELNISNAFVLFKQGYRAWAIEKGEAKAFPAPKGITVEVLREYLPLAREIFIQNPEIHKALFAFNDDIEVVIARPEDDRQLEEEIVFQNWEQLFREKKGLEPDSEVLEAAIRVYPNPVKIGGMLQVEIRVPISLDQARILNSRGEEVQVIKDCKMNENTLNLATRSDLKAGYYYLEIQDFAGRKYQRQVLLEN